LLCFVGQGLRGADFFEIFNLLPSISLAVDGNKMSTLCYIHQILSLFAQNCVQNLPVCLCNFVSKNQLGIEFCPKILYNDN